MLVRGLAQVPLAGLGIVDAEKQAIMRPGQFGPKARWNVELSRFETQCVAFCGIGGFGTQCVPFCRHAGFGTQRVPFPSRFRFITQRVMNREGQVELPHVTQIANIKTAAELRRQSPRQILQHILKRCVVLLGHETIYANEVEIPVRTGRQCNVGREKGVVQGSQTLLPI